MRRALTSTLTPFLFLLLLLAAAPRAEAQIVFGLSRIDYNPETTIVDGFSATQLDYVACFYYAPYIESYLFKNLEQVDDDADLSLNTCGVAAFTDTSAVVGNAYTVIGDHYIVAFYYTPGLGYYDPFGFSGFGGEYGSNEDFNGCYFCGGYYFAEYIYLGSTADFLFAEPPCTSTPELKGPGRVKRGETAEFRLDNLCRNRTIRDWSFTDGSHTVNRGATTTPEKWSGKMVTSGTVRVTVEQRNQTFPLEVPITVDPRPNFALQARPASKMANGVYKCTVSRDGRDVVLELKTPDPPIPGRELGEFLLCQRYQYGFQSVNDQGPNRSFRYVSSVIDRSSGVPDSPDTTFAWTNSPQLENPGGDFFRAQCGDYDKVTNPTGFISGTQLADNTSKHEAGAINSHYQRYVAAQNQPGNNVGLGLEPIVGPPGEDEMEFRRRVEAEGSARQGRILAATQVEPCGESNVRLDEQCNDRGNINFAPFTPCRPSNLRGQAASSSRADLTWQDNSFNEEGFRIERRDGTGAFALAGTAAANATTFADTTVPASTTCTYRMFAFTSARTSPASTEAVVEVPPAKPTGLTAISNPSAPTEVNLRWTHAPHDEDGFKIERKTGSGEWGPVGTAPRSATSFTDRPVNGGTTYAYRVRAFNSHGTSEPSEEASLKTPGSPTAPPGAPPSGATAAAASGTQVNVSWSDANQNEDGFKIERKTSTAAFAQIATVGPNVTAYADGSVAPLTTYTYRVRAYNGAGNSPYSNEISATTPAGQVALPAAPTSLAATATSSTQVSLAWTDASTNEAGFKIERRTGLGAFVQIATVGANVTSFADAGLAGSTLYTYRVRATNSAGDSAYSPQAGVTTPAPPTGPAAPFNLAATAFSSQVVLLWNDTSTDEAGFQIERATSGGAFALIATVGANVTNYADTAVSLDSTYTYRVRAYNGNGNSAWSNEVTATPSLPVPNPPSNLAATAASTSRVDLQWIDNSFNEDGFRLERKTGSGAFTLLATLSAGATTYTDTTVAANTIYSYRIKAFGPGGDSPYAPWATVTTPVNDDPPPPAAPSHLAGATSQSANGVELQWSDNSSNETTFRLEKRRSDSFPFVEVDWIPADNPGYFDFDVTPGVTYLYRVRACNAYGCSGYSGEASVLYQP